MSAAIAALAAFVFVASGTPGRGAQDPSAQPAAGDVLATWQLDGQPRTVTRDDVAVEMAFHLRRRDEGRAAVKHLVDSTLVRRAAEQKKLLPARAEVEAWWEQTKREIRAAGQKPEDLPIVRNTPPDQLLDDFAMQLAHERLVRAELELREGEKVSPAMLQLWLQEARKTNGVIDDPDQLPAGSAARIGDQDLPMLALGRLLLRTSDDGEIDKFVRQVVLLAALEAQARRHAVEVGEADLRAELTLRADAARADPRFQGLTFDQLLASQGLNSATLLQSRVFRAQVMQKKLIGKLHPDEALRAEYERDRQGVLDRAGPRRQIAILCKRATDTPNQLIPLTFEAATKELAELRQKLVDGADFTMLARKASDDPATKARGGSLGWLQRASTALPDEVLAAAWQLADDGLSEPIRSAEGVYLVKVEAIEPEPTERELFERMRDRASDALTRQMLADCRIERVGDKR